MRGKRAVCASLLGALLIAALSVPAREPLTPGSVLPERPSPRRPALPEFLPETPDSGFIPPPAPEDTRPLTAPGGPRFVLRGVVFEGNTVFSEETLGAIADDFVGKKVTLADLEELRYRLTRHYTDQGYINSGAVLKPGQNVDEGVILYQIREGRLNAVRVKGTGRLRPSYVRNRIWSDPEHPLNTQALQERFQLLLQDPLIERLNGELLPGTEPGSAILDLDVTRARFYRLSLGADNYRPPSTGAERVYTAGVLHNLSGYGDTLDFSLGASGGIIEGFAGYTFPITARDTLLDLRFSRSDNAIIEEPLEDLDIKSEMWGLGLGVFHPVYRSLRRTATLGIILARRESQTFLLGEPFPFALGVGEDGKSRTTALRLSQELLDHTAKHALALRSTFSLGIGALGATVHGQDLPDSQFFAWLGQTQYARRLGEQGTQLILRGDVQLANDQLLDLERIAVGGIRTVRGYRENELVRDNGYALSAELRYPVWRGETLGPAESRLHIAAFMDFGTAWNRGQSTHQDYLHSVGLGLLWTLRHWVSGEIYFAHAIREPSPRQEYNLQDSGIHFSVRVNG
jgi:hemolysin activation/secretion protein